MDDPQKFLRQAEESASRGISPDVYFQKLQNSTGHSFFLYDQEVDRIVELYKANHDARMLRRLSLISYSGDVDKFEKFASELFHEDVVSQQLEDRVYANASFFFTKKAISSSLRRNIPQTLSAIHRARSFQEFSSQDFAHPHALTLGMLENTISSRPDTPIVPYTYQIPFDTSSYLSWKN